MPKVTKPVEMESSGYDVVSHCAKIVAAVKKAGGFTPAAIPADIGVLISELPAIISAGQAVSADLKESESEFIKGVNLAAYEMVDAIRN